METSSIVLEDFLHALADPALLTDLDTHVIAVNDRALQLFGLKREEVVGLPLLDIYRTSSTELLTEQHFPALLTAIQEERNTEFGQTVYLVNQEGAIVPVEERAVLLHNEKKQPCAAALILRRVTGKREISKQMLFQSAVLDQMDMAVIVTDLHFNITYWNTAAETLYGWTAEEAVGAPVRLLVPQEGIDDAHRIGKHIRSTQHWSGEFKVKRKDGTEIIVLCTNSVVHDGHGEPIGYIGASFSVSDHVANRQQLEHSYSLLEATLESTANGILVVDREGKITAFNKRFIQMWRIPEELAVLYQDDKMLSYVLDQLADPEHFLSLIDQLYNHPFESRTDTLHFIDGRVFQRYSMPQMLNGHPVGRVWSFRDITQESRDRARLIEQERNFHTLFTGNPYPMFVLSANGLQILAANSAALSHYGYDHTTFLTLTLRDILSNEEHLRLPALEAKLAAASSQRVTEEWYHCRKNGETINAEMTFEPLEFNGAAALLVIVNDITEKKRAQSALHANEELFRALVEKSKDVLFVIDSTGRMTFASSSVEHVLGYAVSEMVGEVIYSYLHQEEHPYINDVMERLLAVEGNSLTIEFRVRHKNGNWLWLEGATTNLLHEPAVHGIIATFRDVTERKQIEQQLIHAKEEAEEMSQLKTSFLTNMSHEVRTPVTAILGFSSLIQEKSEDEEVTAFAERIGRSGTRLLQTINSILDHAKFESDRIDLNMKVTDLGSEVERSVQRIKPAIFAKGLRFTYQCNALVPVRLDSHYFDVVLQHVLGNAVKFTEQGGITVEVSLRDDESGVWGLVEIRDTGIGISREFLPVIFDAFKQESSGYERRYEGSGLGLTVARRLTELMHGRIYAVSTKGAGSTFSLLIPIAPVTDRRSSEMSTDTTPTISTYTTTAPASASPAAQAQAAIVTEKPFPDVLVVEDTHETVELIQYFLRNRARLDVANNAEQAMQKTNAKEYDAILMDVNLGIGPTGLDITKQLRVDRRFRDCPIIAVTAYAMKGDREMAIQSGCTDYLTKPFTRDQLLQMLKKYVAIP